MKKKVLEEGREAVKIIENRTVESGLNPLIF